MFCLKSPYSLFFTPKAQDFPTSLIIKCYALHLCLVREYSLRKPQCKQKSHEILEILS